MEVRNTPGLELQHPQVMNVRESAPESLQPVVQVALDGSSIWYGVVIRETELTDQGNAGVTSQEAEPAAGMIGESLNLCPNGRRRDRTLTVPCTYNFHR